jgi:hypothetical protein
MMSIPNEARKQYVIVYLWNPLTVPDTFKGALFHKDRYVRTNFYSFSKSKAEGIKILHGKQRTAFLSKLGLTVDEESKNIRAKKKR